MTPNPEQPFEPPVAVPVSPDLLAWARQTFDAQEFLEDVRDIEANGGKSLEAFLPEVEAVVRGS
jgi:hypothetical protein